MVNKEYIERNLNTPKNEFCFQVFARILLNKFLISIYNSPYGVAGRTIPFAFLRSFFSYYKINWKDGKQIVKIWVSQGFCEYVKFRGIKLKIW